MWRAPNDGGGNPQRHIYIKRLRLTNSGPSKNANIYWYVDPALNGGDGYDAMYVDAGKAAMIAYDNTYRVVTGTGTGFTSPNEYNPTTNSGYEKNKSLYLASGMKVLTQSGSVEKTATDFWRDTSADSGQGWMGAQVFLPQGVTREVDIIMAGAADNTAGQTGTYTFKLADVLQWFYTNTAAGMQASTDAYWQNWLASGLTIQSPEARYNDFFDRSLLATALHTDGVNGGVIAGFHNGAYPYVWPRDAVYAAITLARSGHLTEARNVYEWMKVTTFREFECNGRKGFWKQKYSTDGYVIWGAPQIDETAVFPWGVKFQYDVTGDTSLLNSYIEQIRDSVAAMTTDSCIDSRSRYEEAFNLAYSMNVWEDSFDTHIYSNANIVRALHDSASIFQTLGLNSEALAAHSKALTIKSGLDARLDWNGENTDISQIGIAYPFNVYSYTDARVNRVMDRINGVATDTFGNNHPLMLFSGEHAGLLDRYWGDNYWNGGPWFLSTVWYGLFYGERQDLTFGTADIDNMKLRVDLCIDRLGPIGFGAEQLAYSNSYLYPGGDFVLQTAWPNAWESMSTFADAVMKFLDYTPDAAANRITVEPKLPSAWPTMTFNNITMADAANSRMHKVSLTVTDQGAGESHLFTNNTGFAVSIQTVLRINGAGGCLNAVLRNGVSVPYSYDAGTGRVVVNSTLVVGAGASTQLETVFLRNADFNQDGGVDGGDVDAFFAAWENGQAEGDFNQDGGIDGADIGYFFESWEAGCIG